MTWGWKDPAIEPPPVRTRIRIRLSEAFRASRKMDVGFAEGYVVEPGTAHMVGFSTTLGPHVTGWQPIKPWQVAPKAGEDFSLDELRGALAAIEAGLAEREAKKARYRSVVADD